MRLSYPGSTLSIYGDGTVPGTESPPVEYVIGIDTHEFYERLVADPSVCFEPRVSNP